MRELGIEFISVFGLPPVDFVHLAPLESLGYPGFSLKDDVRIRHDLLAAMADRGVSISLGEGMVIVPGADVSELADDLDIMAELGAAKINTLSFDKDRNRTFDQLATLTDMAATRGIETTIEMAPGLTIGDLSAVMAAIDHVGSPGLRVTVDTMHVLPEGSHVRADGSGRRGASACRHAAWGPWIAFGPVWRQRVNYCADRPAKIRRTVSSRKDGQSEGESRWLTTRCRRSCDGACRIRTSP